MVDFDLNYPLEKILGELLDVCEHHVVSCDCKDCITLERLTLQIIKEADIGDL